MTLSTWKKSVATMPCAWVERNWDQVGPCRRGAGEAVASQDRSDARLRHADAELLQLADDAEIAPPRVLTGQPADQRHRLAGKKRTSWVAMRVGPALLDQRAMPAEDRLGRDEERTPALPRHKTSQERDECTVGPGETRTADLAAKYGQLVA
jgi:hypothetical protein